ncbi:TniQ protein [Loktanella sp. DSM 29012]|uniref:TniQ family protein n=1 Tax=Loktanella sp. DSM 29012 TaxID=1881056 RepID=UPI0008B9090F|nr:TniQ family protein [Loktanella sp. DSM 29012]SEQ86607.1 TniQ protein [Loktanella sp. DSM 29012]
MSSLSPHLPLKPGESATGFALRLGQFHTGKSDLQLLRHLGIDAMALLSGDQQAVAKLADIANVDLDRLQDGAIARFTRHREFRAERWSRSFVRPDGARYCPKCLLEDGCQAWDRFARISWRIRPVRLCAEHGVVLAACSERKWSDRPITFLNAAGLSDTLKSADMVEVGNYDKWILDRISGRASEQGDFLSSQTLEQGVRVCEMLGATLTYGLDVAATRLSEAELAETAAHGFDIARRGNEAVMDALSEIRALSQSTAGQAKFRAMYGNFYEWVRSAGGDTEPGPIRDLLRDHILKTTALGRGEKVLGHEIIERQMHSAYSLSLATGLHPKRLRKVLVRLGIASADCDDLDYNLLVFPVGDTEKLCQDILTAVPLSRLPDQIGCTRTQAESIYRGGLIRPISNPGDGIGRIDFARSEIDRFLKWIEDLPLIAVTGAVDLTRAAKMTSLSTAEILRRAQAGKLAVGRRTAEPGVNAILVPMTEIQEIQVDTRGPPTLA